MLVVSCDKDQQPITGDYYTISVELDSDESKRMDYCRVHYAEGVTKIIGSNPSWFTVSHHTEG